MKKFIPLLLINIAFSLQYSFCQELRIVAISETFNTTDTIVVGLREDATLGIDPELGEEDISDQPPFGSLDLRVLQRDSSNFVCFFSNEGDNTSLFFEDSFDSKVNFHPNTSNSPLNGLFQVQVNTNDQFITYQFQSDRELSSLFEYVIISFDSCLVVDIDNLPPFFGSPGNLFVLNGVSIKNIIVKFKGETTTASQEVLIKKGIKIYPNPFDDLLVLENSNKEEGLVEIFDIMGRKIQTERLRNIAHLEMNTSLWQPGFYFIRALDEFNNPVGLKKMVKTGR